MNESLNHRVLSVANHIYSTHDTIRKTAKIYGYSKSTIHNDVSVKLKTLNYNLYLKTKDVLEENFAEKHIRGGEATRRKFISTYDKERD